MTSTQEVEIRETLHRMAAAVDSQPDLAERLAATVPLLATAPVPIHKRTRTWLMPLAAAAAVVGLAAGGTALAQSQGGHHNSRASITPAASGPTSDAPAPVTSPSTQSTKPDSATSPPTSSAPGSTSTVPAYTTVDIGKAQIAVPAGWVARDYKLYETYNSTFGPTWCLTPASLQPVSTDRFSCPLTIETIPTGGFPGQPLDVETEGGLSSNPAYCGQTPQTRSVDFADRTFGGRAADYRFFTIKCTTTGKQWQIEQYVVASDPGFILFSETADASVQAAIATIVAHSSLPTQSAPLRYDDHGYVRSIVKVTGGETITLDRVSGPNNSNNNPATYSYTIPDSVVASVNSAPTVGELIEIWTDGHKVIGIG